MPATSINELADPATESTDIVVVIDSPEESSSDQQQIQQSESPSNVTSSPPPGKEKEKNPPPSTSNSTHQEECRICLMSDEVDQLIKPCHCIGSVQFAHLKCLKLWVHERADLHCEICKSMYAEELLPELEPDLLIALEERSRRGRRARYVINHDDPIHQIHSSTAAELRQDQMDHNSRRFWIRAVCITVPITALVVMLLFLGMNANDSEWAAILLRILAFALPTFIVIRIVFTCWDVARSGRSYDDEGIRRGVGV